MKNDLASIALYFFNQYDMIFHIYNCTLFAFFFFKKFDGQVKSFNHAVKSFEIVFLGFYFV